MINLGFEESDVGSDDSGLAAYNVSLVPVDQLVKAILEKSSVNVPAYIKKNPHLETYLYKDNPGLKR